MAGQLVSLPPAASDVVAEVGPGTAGDAMANDAATAVAASVAGDDTERRCFHLHVQT